ncbi:beta-ketoacyl reductase [Desulfovibrio sp. OttesenSCG-928-F20]|nr:beta-ketoacyl reductase [Desulfovibrio sp. OttesenSCG-928-F20]
MRRDASYLVSGGTGGFGLATAKRLAERGAGRLILVSRSGIKDEESRQVVNDMQKLGTTVSVLKADIADAAQLENALKGVLADGPPLAGLVHSAAIIDDAMIPDITPERFRRAVSAKARGAWNLHLATLNAKLDFFVLYSSATTAFGNPGSAAYVAANGLLESLAAARRHMGLAATVIGWGPDYRRWHAQTQRAGQADAYRRAGRQRTQFSGRSGPA